MAPAEETCAFARSRPTQGGRGGEGVRGSGVKVKARTRREGEGEGEGRVEVKLRARERVRCVKVRFDLLIRCMKCSAVQ